MSEQTKCPVTGKTGSATVARGTSNRDWWPNQLNLNILHQHAPASNPLGADFNYAEESLDGHGGGLPPAGAEILPVVATAERTFPDVSGGIR